MKLNFLDRAIEAKVIYQLVISATAALSLALGFFVILALIETTRLTQVGSPTFEVTGNFVGYCLAISGFATAIFISIRQARQLRFQNTQLTNQTQQLEELREISKNLQRDRNLAENIPRFFQSIAMSDERFDCFVPGLDEGKPLPNIKAGDHIALQTYDKFLTPKQLHLVWVNADHAPPTNGHSIHVGSPKANATLRNLCNEETIQAIALPVWFSEVSGRITIYDRVENKHAYSPADPLYDNKHPDHEIAREIDRVEDRAILARLIINDAIHFVVAGIHQYGTWIAAELLDELITGKLDNTELLKPLKVAAMEKSEFVAHIIGFFSSEELRSSSYRLEHLYARSNDAWRKLSDV